MSSEQKNISVVIPTYNRGKGIINLLQGLKYQDFNQSQFEVIVVDDCSEIPVSTIIKPAEYSFKLTIVRHEINKARGAACNTGIKETSGDIVVILDDDISIPKGLLRLHSEFHNDPANENSAAIGALVWGTGPEVTPGMFFLENSEKYFPLYPRILHDNLPSMNTGNVSIRRDFLLENGMFDEDFRQYGYEDIELGERLRSKGLKMPFLNGANVRHLKALNLNEIVQRQFTLGKMKALYYLKNPDGPGSINDLAFIRNVTKLDKNALDREVSIIAGLEKLLEDKQEKFWELPEFHFYCEKMPGIIKAYTTIGTVEQFKTILPEFTNALPILLNSTILMGVGKIEEALIETNKAIKLLPGFLPLQLRIVELLEKLGKRKEAVGLLNLLGTQSPTVQYISMQFAKMQAAMGNTDTAINLCREILEKPETNPLRRRELATLIVKTMLDNNQTEAAFKEAMAFRNIFSTDPYLQYNVASLFEKKGILVTSRDLFKSVLSYLDGLEDCFEFRKLRSGIHYHLGTISLSEKRQKDALLDFSWSVRYNVAHKDAASRMLKLRKNLDLDH